jgi:hypothetical protein
VNRVIATRALRADIRGRVIASDDAHYDEARTPFYGGIERRPEAIVRVADDADVCTLKLSASLCLAPR